MRRKIGRTVLTLLLISMLTIVLSSTIVYAIPSLTPHTNDRDRIEWELDEPVPNGPEEDGDSSHNHRDGDNFFGQQGKVVPNPSQQPYSACGVWDNRDFRVDDVGIFEKGHGFVNEWLWIRDFDGSYGGADKIPRYRFDANVPPGAQARVRDAFSMYDGIGPDRGNLVLGLAFREVTAGPAEILIRWQDIESPGETGPTGGWGEFLNGAPVTVTFDSGRANAWSYNVNPATVPVGQWHFLTVVIHEIGHVVGLDEQNDIDDVMYYKVGLYGFVYLDNEPNGAVSIGDQRIEGHDGFMHTATGARYAEGTVAAAGGSDIGLSLVAFPANAKHTGNAPYDPSEIIYLDNDNNNKVSVGDARMVKVIAGGVTYEGGSIVAAGDNDVGSDLVVFQANERHTGPGPWKQALDAETIHGVRDLYSIPAPDWGDAPDDYPVKWAWKGKNGPYCPNFGDEWLGPRPATGISSTTGERVPKQVDLDVPDNGVVFAIGPGGPGGGTVTVTVSVSNGGAQRYAVNLELYVAIWIDWNRDQDWKANERVVLDRFRPSTFGPGNTETRQYTFDVPKGWQETWARARLAYTSTGGYLASDQGDEGLLPVWESPDNGGEIEDYKVHPPSGGGFSISLDKPRANLLAPNMGSALTIITATVAATIGIRRVKSRKKKQ